MKLLYCQQCKYICQYSSGTVGTPKVGKPPNMYCNHAENIISKSWNTWYQNVKDVKYSRKPSEINKNNDCSWFGPINIPMGGCIGTRSLKQI
jgi:hypothetical protein